MKIVPVTPQPRIVAPSAPLVDELLVTARKRPERLDSLPAGVSVVSADQLLITNAYDVRATAGQLVGVLTTNLGPGRDKILIRGLSDGAFTGHARSTVSTYLDDAPLNYNAPDPDLRLTDVAQVETVRGPQGALYGTGAISGVYRIVTNKPDPDRYAAGAQAGLATTRGGSASYSADGFANLPLAMGRAALRLVAYYDDQGGYLDDISLHLPNVDSTLREGARATLRLEIDPSWTVDMGLVAQRLTSRDTQYTTLTNSLKRANQVRESSDNDFGLASMSIKGDLGFADLNATTSYVQHAFSALYDASAADIAQFSTTGAASLGVYSEAARIRRFVQDVVLTSTDAGPFSWLAGVYGSTSRDRTPGSLDILVNGSAAIPPLLVGGAESRLSAQLLPVDPAGPPSEAPAPLTRVYNEDRRDLMSEAAVYGEATWRFAPGWTLSGGARAFATGLKVRSHIVGAPPTQPRDIAVNRSFEGATSKAAVQYQFDDEGPLVYALFSDGLRPGGVNTTNFLTIHPNRTTFEPDRLRNYELGAKGVFLDRRLVLRGAAFYDLWTNIQSDQYRASGLAYT
ncbi:MAG: TonB-dependent receptor, partial [Proteobacteria bacterium]|nr:TonB-dependent receptor [Pseudomonadota bacterium]